MRVHRMRWVDVRLTVYQAYGLEAFEHVGAGPLVQRTDASRLVQNE